MAREVLGHMVCPECGSEAEVKKQKNGLAYRWCTECNAQYFPRTAEASDRLLEKCGAQKPVPVPKKEPVTVTAPSGNVTSITTTTTTTPVPVPVSAPKAKPKASPFDILGQFNK
ncbi:MAG: hypothetical protein ACOYB2_03020 [Limnohabitans sp.]